MVLIADSGSTNCQWCLAGATGPRTYFSTEGYNPYAVGTAAIVASLGAALPPALPRAQVQAVHFYGAGITDEGKAEIVAAALRQLFPGAHVTVAEDMLAAARALLGRRPGLAAILGTGQNSALYDGQCLTHTVEGLSYVLGEEGAGTYLGKRLLRDFLRQRLPPALQTAFAATYQPGPLPAVLDRVYAQPAPNRYLASFAPFAHQHYAHSYCRALVAEAMEAFFTEVISYYPDYQRYSFNCVGSVGYAFREALAETAARHGMLMGQMLESPIEALTDYHLSS
jgi:glucosamine kinase